MNRIYGILTVVLCLSMLVLPGVQGAERRGSPLTVDVAKQPEGPFEQTQSTTIAKGASKKLYFGVFSTAPRKIRLSDETFVGLGSRYSVKWYEGLKAKKSADITKKMLGNGFKFETTEASTQDYFTAKVSYKSGDRALCLTAFVESLEEPFDDNAIAEVNGRCPGAF